MTDLLMIRHGPTMWNAGKRLQGETDIPLSPQGRTVVSAWRVPRQYAHYRCLASPLSRAMETARILGFEPEPVEALREMSWGQWEGQQISELRTRLGAEMADNEARGLDFRPAGGESPRDVQDRLRPWLNCLREPTLAIAHKGVLRALYAMASGWDMRGKPEIRLEDQTAHLFQTDDQGGIFVARLNIKLVGL